MGIRAWRFWCRAGRLAVRHALTTGIWLLGGGVWLSNPAGHAAGVRVLLQEGFETGAPGWTGTIESGSVAWCRVSDPQTVRVWTPTLTPDVVQLPDSGALPAAFEGRSCFWFGSAELSPGTFLGEFAADLQAPLGGGPSTERQQATLLSPPVDLTGESAARLQFQAWWEVEGVELAAGQFDQMEVYAVTAAGQYELVGTLNPLNDPDGEAFRPYSSGGLGRPGVWVSVAADLSAQVGQSVRLAFRFDSGDCLYNAFRGWLIDTVEVTGGGATAPAIAGVTPTAGGAGAVVRVHGSGFVLGAQAALGRVPVATAVVSCELAQLEVPADLDGGWYDLSVMNPDGQTASLAAAFLVSRETVPDVTHVDPGWGPAYAATDLAIGGSGFEPGVAVLIGGWPAEAVVPVDTHTIECLAPASLAPGFHNVTVVGPSGLSATLVGGYEARLSLDCDGSAAYGVHLLRVGPRQGGLFPELEARVWVDSEAGRGGALGLADFTVREDGLAQAIRAVVCSRSVGAVADIALCVDVSGSMADQIVALRSGVAQLALAFGGAGADVRLALVPFRDTVTLGLDFVADTTALQTALGALVASGGEDLPEACLDAAMLALGHLAWRAEAQRVLVVVTDAPAHYRGDGTAVGAYTCDEVAAAASAAGVDVVAFGPDLAKGSLAGNCGARVTPKADPAGQDDLRTFAEATAGIWRPLASVGLPESMECISDLVLSNYTVTYTTTQDRSDGTRRRVVVTVSDPVLGPGCDAGSYESPLVCLQLAVEPGALDVACLPGTRPEGAVIAVATSGAGLLEYRIASDAPWLVAWPAEGASSWEWNSHRVDFSPEALLAGTYEGTLAVTGAGQARTISVTLTVVDLLVRRSFPAGTHVPGAPLDVTLELAAAAGICPASCLVIHETLPPGWSYLGLSAASPAPEIQVGPTPQDLRFVWTEEPALPQGVTYRVQAPTGAGAAATAHCFSGRVSWASGDSQAEGLTLGDECLPLSEGEEPCTTHMADQNRDWVLDLSPELTRLVQFHNRRGYHSQTGSEDGFAPGPGATAGSPHQADLNQDWVLQLSPELTRVVQLHNQGGYHCQAGTEDGYAPGAPGKGALRKGMLTATRAFGSVFYPVGETLTVQVTLAHTSPEAVASLVVREVLPPGWSFAGVTSEEAPAIQPTVGVTGTLEFAWIGMPVVWPVSLVYLVGIPATAAGPEAIAGSASFREDAGELTVTTPPTTIYDKGVTLSFVAGSGGTLAGPTLQSVPPGASAAPVTAVPATGHYFLQWTRNGAYYSRANPLTVAAVEEAMTLTAVFGAEWRTVLFRADAGGRIAGDADQVVYYGCDCTTVRAVPRFGFVFVGWDDGCAAATRTVVEVTANQVLTALFRVAEPVPPEGVFQALADSADVASGRGLWVLTGPYATTVAGQPLALGLIHDPKGKLTGTATYTPAEDPAFSVPIKGTAKGAAGEFRARFGLKGSDPTGALALTLALDLALEADACQLEGSMAGSLALHGAGTPVSSSETLPIPAPMDGTWALELSLTQGPKAVTGTAQLTLASGATYRYVVKGKLAGQCVSLSLAAAPGDPAAKAIRFKAVITPLEGGWARLEHLSGKGYGQTLAW